MIEQAQGRLSLLIDTNVVIPLEPTSPQDATEETPATAELHRLALSDGVLLYLHPIQRTELSKDREPERRSLRLQLSEKYLDIPNAPKPDEALLEKVGNPAQESNDWVDAHLLVTILRHAASFLVTHDRRLLRKARKLGIEERILSVDQACALLRPRTVAIPVAQPSIRFDHCHNLDLADPIFDSFRSGYPEFDQWFRQKCLAAYAGKSRPAIVATLTGKRELAGLAILKTDADSDLPGTPVKTIKICSLKVADDALGLKLGELLLSAVFQFAWHNRALRLFVEVFPRHEELIYLLDLLGFEDTGVRTKRGEFVWVKQLAPEPGEDRGERLEFHRKFGPYQIFWEGAEVFLVPIRPEFHARLFPKMEQQASLWEGHESCGNTLLKAYICRASTNQMRPGDVIAFYRSSDIKAITTLGVIEDTKRSISWQEIRDFTMKRTVFGENDLKNMCGGLRGTLAILFRHAPLVRSPLTLSASSHGSSIPRAGQSITRLTSEQILWLKSQIQ